MLVTPLFTPNVAAADQPAAGVLDTPIVAGASKEDLRSELKSELEQLKKMSPEELKRLAESGSRAARVLLAEEFAKEAASLSFAPAAANAAASDAARLYSIAAGGYPGAPSLDYVGVKVYPITIQRSR